MDETDSNRERGREVGRPRGAKALNANSGVAVDSGALTRSGTGLETRIPDGRRRDSKPGKAESVPPPGSLTEQLQMKAAAREAALAAAALQTTVVAAQAQLKSAQQELETQRDVGIQDAARMAVRVSLLEEELAVVAMHAITDRGELSKARNQWRGAASAVTVLSILCLVWWWITPRPAPNVAQVVARDPAAVNQPAFRSEPSKDNHLPADPHAALTMGLDRLNAALADVPGTSPEEVLRKVSASGQDCAMVWTNDLPSLLFPGKRQAGVPEPGQTNALANTLADCAEAVSRFSRTPQPADPALNSGQSRAPGSGTQLLR